MTKKQYGFRFESSLIDKAQKKAKEEYMSFNSWVEKLIAKALKKKK